MKAFCDISLADLVSSSSDEEWDEIETRAPRKTTKKEDWVASLGHYRFIIQGTTEKCCAQCIILVSFMFTLHLSVEYGRLEYFDLTLLLVTNVLGLDRYYGPSSDNQTIVVVMWLVSFTALYALVSRKEYLLLPYLGLQCLLVVASWLVFLCPILYLFYNLLKFVFIYSLNLVNIILPHDSPQNVYLFEYLTSADGVFQFSASLIAAVWKVTTFNYVLCRYSYMKFVRCANYTKIQPVQVVEVLHV